MKSIDEISRTNTIANDFSRFQYFIDCVIIKNFEIIKAMNHALIPEQLVLSACMKYLELQLTTPTLKIRRREFIETQTAGLNTQNRLALNSCCLIFKLKASRGVLTSFFERPLKDDNWAKFFSGGRRKVVSPCSRKQLDHAAEYILIFSALLSALGLRENSSSSPKRARSAKWF